jgi:hypothetical protein
MYVHHIDSHRSTSDCRDVISQERDTLDYVMSGVITTRELTVGWPDRTVSPRSPPVGDADNNKEQEQQQQQQEQQQEQQEQEHQVEREIPEHVVLLLQSFWRYQRARITYKEIYNKRKWTLHKEPINRIGTHVRAVA